MTEAFVFPEVAAQTDQRPRACPRCGQLGMGHPRYVSVHPPQCPTDAENAQLCAGSGYRAKGSTWEHSPYAVWPKLGPSLT